jgi:Arc/MetJ family transcription regulator
MRTNIDIDDELMKQVMEGSGAKTKKAAVETAMRRFVQLQQQEEAIHSLRGIAVWEGDLEESRLGRFVD